MKKIPFSPPFINQTVLDEVNQTLESGWITTGPKVKEFEKALAEFIGIKEVIPVNSWTSGAILSLKWLELEKDDEVIVPAYTYAATALAVIHAGGKPVIVDVQEDFSIDPKKVAEALSSKTKAVIGVDYGGWPADYLEIDTVLEDRAKIFEPKNEIQKKLGRPLLLADAAHSLGAERNEQKAGHMADISVFSFHAVKNLTTAEGGAIVLNLPDEFDPAETYRWFQLMTLNGQTKNALEKSIGGNWKYDIVLPGLKINLPDVLAAIGLAQLKHYDEILKTRKAIFDRYVEFFKGKEWSITPEASWSDGEPSCHLYPFRLTSPDESKRDELVEFLNQNGIASNVHFIPLPRLSLFKEMGFDISDFPVANRLFSSMISLPIYPSLTSSDQDYVLEKIEEGAKKILS